MRASSVQAFVPTPSSVAGQTASASGNGTQSTPLANKALMKCVSQEPHEEQSREGERERPWDSQMECVNYMVK